MISIHFLSTSSSCSLFQVIRKCGVHSLEALMRKEQWSRITLALIDSCERSPLTVAFPHWLEWGDFFTARFHQTRGYGSVHLFIIETWQTCSYFSGLCPRLLLLESRSSNVYCTAHLLVLWTHLKSRCFIELLVVTTWHLLSCHLFAALCALFGPRDKRTFSLGLRGCAHVAPKAAEC